jgi:peroxiredoxin
MRVKFGDNIGDFVLDNQEEKKINTADFKKKRLLLSFHPLAWTVVCAAQMKSLDVNFKQFEGFNTVALGISVDTAPSKKAWAENLGLKHTNLLSDFWPHGAFALKLGIFINKFGISERANIILDENRKVIFAKVYPIKDLPDINEIILFLKKSK